jgi:hypothetical protein
VLSCVGGHRTATALIDEGLVTDIYLTTSPRDGGERTPRTTRAGRCRSTRVVRKDGLGSERGVVFEHLRFEDS